MASIIVGLVCIALFLLLLFSALPWDFLHLTDEIIFVFQGLVPLVIVVFGLLSVLIGITDIIDRRQAKKETKLQEEFEKSQTNKS